MTLIYCRLQDLVAKNSVVQPPEPSLEILKNFQTTGIFPDQFELSDSGPEGGILNVCIPILPGSYDHPPLFRGHVSVAGDCKANAFVQVERKKGSLTLTSLNLHLSSPIHVKRPAPWTLNKMGIKTQLLDLFTTIRLDGFHIDETGRLYPEGEVLRPWRKINLSSLDLHSHFPKVQLNLLKFVKGFNFEIHRRDDLLSSSSLDLRGLVQLVSGRLGATWISTNLEPDEIGCRS